MTQEKPSKAPYPTRRLIIGLVLVIVVVAGLAALWWLTSAATYANPETLAQALEGLLKTPWAPLSILVIYLVANTVIFPTIILNITMIVVLGPLWGFVAAWYGSISAGAAAFAAGRRLGQDRIRRIESKRLQQMVELLERSGVPGIAILRVVPVAPYPVVNVVLGAASIRWFTFLLGTAIGLLPSLLAMTAVGHQAKALMDDPDPTQLAILGLVILLCGALLWGVKRLARRRLAAVTD